MSTYDSIRELVSMLNLHTRGKKMRALEILEDFLFGNSLPGLTHKELQVLLLGLDGHKGLVQSMGGENHLRKSLKNSSHYCLQLVVKILNIPKWRTDAYQVLQSIDRLIIQQMKIDKHFKSADSSRSYAIYILCLKINKIKPALTPEIIITRKNFRDKFLAWAKTQRDETVDSLSESKEKPKSIPDILGLKPYITIPSSISAIMIDQIDMRSSHFKANVYIEKAHGTLSHIDIPKAIENLRRLYLSKQSAMGRTITENSIIFGETRSYFEELKTSITNQLTFGPAIKAHEMMLETEAAENLYLSPLLKQRAEMERLKKIMQLTYKYSYLFKLPNTLQSHLSRADIDSVVDVYQRHVVIIKTYSHLPVFSKVVKNLETILTSVKTFILQELRKNKRITFENVMKAVNNLKVLEPKGDTLVDVAQVIYEIIDNYLDSMWTRIDKQHELPWLAEFSDKTADLNLQQSAVEQLIIRILDNVYIYIEILAKLAQQTSGKKIKRKMQKISGLLTTKLSMSLFQDDSDQPLRLFCIDEVSLHIKKIAMILTVPSFAKFCEDFSTSFIKTKFHLLQAEIAELWKEEIWSKDFENQYGTCVPRVFECILLELIGGLKESLPAFEAGVLGCVGEGVSLCFLALLQAMKTALNSSTAVNETVSKTQRTLLTISNVEYVLLTVFPKITNVLTGLFQVDLPEQAKEALNDSIQQVTQFSQALKKFFIENKSLGYYKVIEEGVLYNEELIGIDANIVYKHLLSERKDMKELRSYVFILINKLLKITHHLNRKSPEIKAELLEMVISSISENFRKIIQKNHRSFGSREIIQIWVEVEFFEKFIGRFKCENIAKCYHNLRKIWSKIKGSSKLAGEAEIFGKDVAGAKENLIKNEIEKVKLMQSCLEN